MPLKLKGKLYTTVVRPALTYSSECWTRYEKASLVERNIKYKLLADATSSSQHVTRLPPENPVKAVMALEIPKLAKKGRPKLTWTKQQQQLDRVAQGNLRETRSTARRRQQQVEELGRHQNP